MPQPPTTLDELGAELTSATSWDQVSINFVGLTYNASQTKHLYSMAFDSYIVASGVLTVTGILATNNGPVAIEYVVEQSGVFFGFQKIGVAPAQDIKEFTKMQLDNDLLENSYLVGAEVFIEAFDKII